MGKYGEAAVTAARIFTEGDVDSPETAWNRATTLLMGANTSSQKKGCPRGAFLGLCEEGLVKGIPKGHYTNSEKNKGYAVEAVSLLKSNPGLSQDANLLWAAILKGIEKKHNSQMDVVLSLWNHKLIR